MRRRASQRGITLVVIAIAMFSLIAIAGLALDIGNLVVNKARFQATVDSAALTAAKILDTTTSTAAATAAARSVFATNAAQQSQLWAVFGRVRQQIEYSNTLQPFNPGSAPPLYVRVRASNFGITAT
ncbi:MAG: pilus assembly protein TadG-related protein, partial [Candidatus Sulfotelmatobacter sp.]